jgi:hypothetical protein
MYNRYVLTDAPERFFLLQSGLGPIRPSAMRFTDCGDAPGRWNQFHRGIWNGLVWRAAEIIDIIVQKPKAEIDSVVE